MRQKAQRWVAVTGLLVGIVVGVATVKFGQIVRVEINTEVGSVMSSRNVVIINLSKKVDNNVSMLDCFNLRFNQGAIAWLGRQLHGNTGQYYKNALLLAWRDWPIYRPKLVALHLMLPAHLAVEIQSWRPATVSDGYSQDRPIVGSEWWIGSGERNWPNPSSLFILKNVLSGNGGEFSGIGRFLVGAVHQYGYEGIGNDGPKRETRPKKLLLVVFFALIVFGLVLSSKILRKVYFDFTMNGNIAVLGMLFSATLIIGSLGVLNWFGLVP